MKSTRRTTTTVEVREVVVIKAYRGKQVLCPECADGGLLVPVGEATKMSGFSGRAIYRLIESGDVHFAETADESTLICWTTLLVQMKKEVDW